MLFFGLPEGSCRKRVDSGHVALGEVNYSSSRGRMRRRGRSAQSAIRSVRARHPPATPRPPPRPLTPCRGARSPPP
eukprot:1004170-Prymnesium_polylepis.1